ncbi:hypothetical protein DUNSADRAFT_17493 [Dunaliella salina]|uniref:Uncharacterized protein n=1 Tax=Dunaliella salina TaxID=3046 RepID=A0ABQ7G1M7_DUNSA|nr:hypothetical protein DUNSADRAFT_17493 [Dunaliella salina]|eukprot:KAF5828514.1 hypothetical protein DUNSADRAFT_17493 [Dunaliella salina]
MRGNCSHPAGFSRAPAATPRIICALETWWLRTVPSPGPAVAARSVPASFTSTCQTLESCSRVSQLHSKASDAWALSSRMEQPSYDIKLQIQDPPPQDRSKHPQPSRSAPASLSPKPFACHQGREFHGSLREHAEWCVWWGEQLSCVCPVSKAQAQQTLLALAQISETSGTSGTSLSPSTAPLSSTPRSGVPMTSSNSSSSSSTSCCSPFLASVAPQLRCALPFLDPHALVQAAEAMAALEQGPSSSHAFQPTQHNPAVDRPLPQYQTGSASASMFPAVESTLPILGEDPEPHQQQQQQQQQLEGVHQQELLSGNSNGDSTSVYTLMVVEAILEACELRMGDMSAPQLLALLAALPRLKVTPSRPWITKALHQLQQHWPSLTSSSTSSSTSSNGRSNSPWGHSQLLEPQTHFDAPMDTPAGKDRSYPWGSRRPAPPGPPGHQVYSPHPPAVMLALSLACLNYMPEQHYMHWLLARMAEELELQGGDAGVHVSTSSSSSTATSRARSGAGTTASREPRQLSGSSEASKKRRPWSNSAGAHGDGYDSGSSSTCSTSSSFTASDVRRGDSGSAACKGPSLVQLVAALSSVAQGMGGGALQPSPAPPRPHRGAHSPRQQHKHPQPIIQAGPTPDQHTPMQQSGSSFGSWITDWAGAVVCALPTSASWEGVLLLQLLAGLPKGLGVTQALLRRYPDPGSEASTSAATLAAQPPQHCGQTPEARGISPAESNSSGEKSDGSGEKCNSSGEKSSSSSRNGGGSDGRETAGGAWSSRTIGSLDVDAIKRGSRRGSSVRTDGNSGNQSFGQESSRGGSSSSSNRGSSSSSSSSSSGGRSRSITLWEALWHWTGQQLHELPPQQLLEALWAAGQVQHKYGLAPSSGWTSTALSLACHRVCSSIGSQLLCTSAAGTPNATASQTHQHSEPSPVFMGGRSLVDLVHAVMQLRVNLYDLEVDLRDMEGSVYSLRGGMDAQTASPQCGSDACQQAPAHSPHTQHTPTSSITATSTDQSTQPSLSMHPSLSMQPSLSTQHTTSSITAMRTYPSSQPSISEHLSEPSLGERFSERPMEPSLSERLLLCIESSLPSLPRLAMSRLAAAMPDLIHRLAPPPTQLHAWHHHPRPLSNPHSSQLQPQQHPLKSTQPQPSLASTYASPGGLSSLYRPPLRRAWVRPRLLAALQRRLLSELSVLCEVHGAAASGGNEMQGGGAAGKGAVGVTVQAGNGVGLHTGSPPSSSPQLPSSSSLSSSSSSSSSSSFSPPPMEPNGTPSPQQQIALPPQKRGAPASHQQSTAGSFSASASAPAVASASSFGQRSSAACTSSRPSVPEAWEIAEWLQALAALSPSAPHTSETPQQQQVLQLIMSVGMQQLSHCSNQQLVDITASMARLACR